MPSCSGNHKQVMTGGGVRSMLRRAGAGLRKLTKRSKPQTRAAEFEMVNLSPKVATTRFGSKSKYNSRAAHRQAISNLEGYVGLQRNALTHHGKFKTEICQKATEKLEKKNDELEKKYDKLFGEFGAGAQAHVRDVERGSRACHTKDSKIEQLTKDLEAAVSKLAECESGKASGSRRRKAAAKMYRQAHIDRTIGAIDTEDALDKTIEAEELLAKERERAAKARLEANEAQGMLDKEMTAAKSDQRRLASTERKRASSAERRTQRRFPISDLNIAKGASRMSLKRTMRNTKAVAANHNAFMAKQQQNQATMNAYQAGRRANTASMRLTANKAKALIASNALTRAIEKRRRTPQKTGGSSKTNEPVVGLRFTSSG